MPVPHVSLIARSLAIAVVGAAAIVPSVTTSSVAVASGVRAVLPSVSVADVSVGEGTGGTTTAVFTITQDKRGKSTINFSTAPDTGFGSRRLHPPIREDPVRWSQTDANRLDHDHRRCAR
jgi:hypothetical protein